MTQLLALPPMNHPITSFFLLSFVEHRWRFFTVILRHKLILRASKKRDVAVYDRAVNNRFFINYSSIRIIYII